MSDRASLLLQELNVESMLQAAITASDERNTQIANKAFAIVSAVQNHIKTKPLALSYSVKGCHSVLDCTELLRVKLICLLQKAGWKVEQAVVEPGSDWTSKYELVLSWPDEMKARVQKEIVKCGAEYASCNDGE
ncbi:hypothetical protein HDU87_006176 [Geranomyces variabilis]|uniref:Uncharacterized protein n=1 Tax=Geranomyces variabilis TaxID=109894 RepID=A0AAD5XNN1_9FUNG|nr:hypothetical protein HDU87_006176 [Geranomyces variabilis]